MASSVTEETEMLKTASAKAHNSANFGEAWGAHRQTLMRQWGNGSEKQTEFGSAIDKDI